MDAGPAKVGAALVLALLSGCATLCPRSAPVGPALPPGCVRVTDGTGALLSPDGRLLAFHRWHTINGKRVLEEEKEWFSGKSAEPLIPERWVRDLAGWREWRLPDPDEVPRDLTVTAWTPDGLLLLSDGRVVDPCVGGPAVSAAPLPPPAVVDRFPAGDVPRPWAWTRDGRRLAWIGAAPADEGAASPRWSVWLSEAGRTPERIEFDGLTGGGGHEPLSAGLLLLGGRVVWSPDGRSLFARLALLRFAGAGPDDVERTALVFPGTGRVEVLGEWTSVERAPEPRSGPGVWDTRGRRCAFVGATASKKPAWGAPWVGTTDVYVGEVGGGPARRVTFDGEKKTHPAIHPDKNWVAFVLPDRDLLRVLDVDRGHAWETPLGPPPDAWSRFSSLRWTPDGCRLLYAYLGVEGAVYLQAVPEEIAPR